MALSTYTVFYPYTGTAPLSSQYTTVHKSPSTIDPYPGGTSLTSKALFPISQWSNDIEQTLNIGSQSTGAGAGKVTFNPFSITRKIDSISPTLFGMCASGTPFKFIDLIEQQTVGKSTVPSSFLAYRFGLAAVKTIGWSLEAGVLHEVVSFEYGQLQIGYAVQKSDGTAGKFTFVGWDRVRNVKS